MTEDELNSVTETIGNEFLVLYSTLKQQFNGKLVLMGITGALAACSLIEKIERKNLIAALNSALDDIYEKEKP